MVKTYRGLVELHRLQEFKFNDSVGAVGQTRYFEYIATNFLFSVARGKTAGYSRGEDFATVIQVIPPGSKGITC